MSSSGKISETSGGPFAGADGVAGGTIPETVIGVISSIGNVSRVTQPLVLGDANQLTTAIPAAMWINGGGTTWDRFRTARVVIPLDAVAIGAEATLWTPASTRKFRLMGGVLSAGTVGGRILLKDNTGGATIAVIPTTALNAAVSFDLRNGILSAAANNVLTGTGAATETVTGLLYGLEE